MLGSAECARVPGKRTLRPGKPRIFIYIAEGMETPHAGVTFFKGAAALLALDALGGAQC